MEADKRIAELEADVASKDARIAEQDARIAEQDARIAEQDARIAELEALVAKLLEQVAALSERLGENSGNSSKPPSSDPPGTGSKKRNAAKRERKKRKRGGQRGHKGNHRELLAESEVDEFVDFFPENCESCWEPLHAVADPRASRFQVSEVPPPRVHTTEYRCHAILCRCGYESRGRLSDDVPSSPFGPRLASIAALLTGVYHVSRRRAVKLLSDLLGVRISLGALSALEARVSDAIKPAFDEAWEKVGDEPVKHTDGTSWRSGNAATSLWTIATTMMTVFKIVVDGSKKTLEPLYGALTGILVSDRATALNFWAIERRQICWAHLIRKFVSFSERDGPAKNVGNTLLEYAGLVFEYWRAHKSGELTAAAFHARIRPVQTGIEELLERAAAADIVRLSGSCQNMLDHREALWTFVDTDGVEPTNNHAERELRAFVLWRKRSFGSQSDRGDRFAERIMTVAHTARKQDSDVLPFLTAAVVAERDGTKAPSLFAQSLAHASA